MTTDLSDVDLRRVPPLPPGCAVPLVVLTHIASFVGPAEVARVAAAPPAPGPASDADGGSDAEGSDASSSAWSGSDGFVDSRAAVEDWRQEWRALLALRATCRALRAVVAQLPTFRRRLREAAEEAIVRAFNADARRLDTRVRSMAPVALARALPDATLPPVSHWDSERVMRAREAASRAHGGKPLLFSWPGADEIDRAVDGPWAGRWTLLLGKPYRDIAACCYETVVTTEHSERDPLTELFARRDEIRRAAFAAERKTLNIGSRPPSSRAVAAAAALQVLPFAVLAAVAVVAATVPRARWFTAGDGNGDESWTISTGARFVGIVVVGVLLLPWRRAALGIRQRQCAAWIEANQAGDTLCFRAPAAAAADDDDGGGGNKASPGSPPRGLAPLHCGFYAADAAVRWLGLRWVEHRVRLSGGPGDDAAAASTGAAAAASPHATKASKEWRECAVQAADGQWLWLESRQPRVPLRQWAGEGWVRAANEAESPPATALDAVARARAAARRLAAAGERKRAGAVAASHAPAAIVAADPINVSHRAVFLCCGPSPLEPPVARLRLYKDRATRTPQPWGEGYDPLKWGEGAQHRHFFALRNAALWLILRTDPDWA